VQTIQEAIRAELLRRRRRNPRYSLRSFARDLEISPGRLSEFINGKRAISEKWKPQLIRKLGLGQDIVKLADGLPKAGRLLCEDELNVIREPYFSAILSLLDTREIFQDSTQIGGRLGLLPSEARSALAVLARLGLVKNLRGRWMVNQVGTHTSNDIPSAALREYHRRAMQQAQTCLDEVPVDLRDITSVMLAIDPSKLPIAKRRIQRFRKSLERLLESGTKSEVYTLNIQLVPVSKTKKEKLKC
jgi:uncharacterized protein (TIGR02147 family)